MYVNLIVGFVLLLGGAEILVRGAVGLAERLGVSKLVIGMTVIAFGTSAPELIVSLNATLNGSPGLAVGNLVGSNVANILLILGVSGMIQSIKVDSKALTRDGWVLLLGTAAFIAFAVDGAFELYDGLLLLLMFSGFLYYTFDRERNGALQHSANPYEQGVNEKAAVFHTFWIATLLVCIGFACLIGGSELLVSGGVAIARSFGITEAVIGLTIIAFGTSLPELAASAVAAYRKHTDLAVGNIVGSNLFNILGIAGLIAVITPMHVPSRIMYFDMWIMFAVTLILTPYLIGNKEVIGRTTSGFFVVAYLAYITAVGYGIESFK